MKKFAYIENGKVEEVGDLPRNFKNVSNFSALENNLERLKIFNWLPVETIKENKPIVVSTEYVIEEDLVKEIITTRNLTEEEIEENTKREIEQKWNDIRRERNSLLSQSDVHILIDKWEDMTEGKKTEWKAYRQSLRDVPQNFENPDEVVWPVKPN